MQESSASMPSETKIMATYSSVLAWRIPGMVDPGGLLSMGSHRVGHDWSDLAAAAASLKSSTNSKSESAFFAMFIENAPQVLK